MHYGMVIDLERCVGCGACSMACKQVHGTPPGIWWSKVLHGESGKYPNSRITLLPTLCMHCVNPPCKKACPTGATYQRQDGIVLVDKDKCIGCRYCMTACPYVARSFNWRAEGSYFGELGPMPNEKLLSSEHPSGVVEKCTFCAERLDVGLQPACVSTCPAKARIFGDLDDPNSEVSMLLTTGRDSQISPELGTNPSVYYLSASRERV